MHTPKPYQHCLSSSIGSEGASHFLFATCRRAKKENKVKTGVIPERKSEVDVNKAYLYSSSEDSSLDIDSLSSSSKDEDDDQNHWEDMVPGF